MYYSTFHWQNLLNGYSGFLPPSYDDLVRTLTVFPDDDSIWVLRQRHKQYVVVHGELMASVDYERLIHNVSARPELVLVARRPWKDREIALYRLQ
jgi:hypothetical protein